MTAPGIGTETMISVTFFPNAAAQTKREEALHLHDLANRIATTTASGKTTLPWMKLARFGDLRTTDANSLRHNANVVTISGVEADYDGEKISFTEAVDTLRKAGVEAIVYTSPSHAEDAPRWRVLCPLSKELPPEQRSRHLARLNGLFGGIFSGESWTLSQSYYYGSVNRSPSHHVQLIDGTPIDQMPELDAGAISKQPGGKAANGNGAERPIGSGGTYTPASDARLEAWRQSVLDNLRSEAVEGQKHFALLRHATALGGIQAAVGFSDAAAIQWLMDALPDTVLNWDAAKRTAADGLARGRAKPIELEDRPRPFSNGPHSPFDIHDHDVGDPPPPTHKPNGADVAPDPHDDPPPADDTANAPSHHPRRNRQRSIDDPAFVWPAPLDFLADPNSEAPELRHEHIPEAINDFVFDAAARMGVDPTSVALGCIVSLASVANDDWQVQPKRHDYTWTESARLWGAILGLPSIKKTPVITACTKPIDKLGAAARRRHAEAMRTYKQQMKAAKADKSGETPEPTHPKLDHYLIENITTEALSEVLREDDDAHQRAPSRKVLCRQDEMSEFFANLDRYHAGGKGGADRGAYLRLYNGGPYTTDRIGRGSCTVPNWSAGFLGGMQPGPIQRIAKNTTEDGLLQRLLYAVPGPHQTRGADRKPSAPAQERYNALFPALAAMHPPRTQGDHAQIEIVVFHADAQQHREAVELRAEIMAQLPDTSTQLQSAYGKWPGLFARIALTFHLIEIADAHATGTASPYPLVISEQTARRAAAFMLEIALPHLLRAHRLMFSTAQTGHAQWIGGYILAERLERITSRDVVRVYRSLRAPEARDELVAVMASLVISGWLEPEVPTNPAKPVSAWAVNPAVHVRFADLAEREQTRREKARVELANYFAAQKTRQAEIDAP